MKTIVMDTSNTYLAIALYEDNNCLDKYQEEGNKKQSEYAITYLEKMLNNHQLNVLDFDEMIITIGPGSYTGQRVALTIAKTLAAISDIKIKVVSSLHSYVGNKKGISIIDARSKKIFVGVYDNNNPVVDDQIMLIEDFDTFKKEYSDYLIYGDSQIVGKEKIDVDLCQNIYEAGKNVSYVEDVDNLIPRYLKEVDAKKIC